MRADAEFQFPPDFLVYLHYGSVIHLPQALPPSSSTQQPIRQSPSPAMKAFTVNTIGRWSELPAAASFTSVETVQREPDWRSQPAVEVAARPWLTLIDAVLGNQAVQLARLLNDPAIVAHIDAEDETGRSALDHALERRNFPLARQLVRLGAKIADDITLDAGLLIDLIAAGEMHLALEVTKLRLTLTRNSHNDSPKEVQRWQVPLFMAIRAGNLGLVRQLADPQTLKLRDRVGGNALHFAASSPAPLVLASLLAAGARTDIRNRSGQDPAGTAGSHGRPEFIQLLQAFSVQD